VRLIGRAQERETLDGIVAAALRGMSAVTVVLGDAGVGKTALLEETVARATGVRALRVTGIETDASLGYAGLETALGPLLPAIGELPGPQQAALAAALGRESSQPASPFLVALAALTLLTNRSSEQPTLCVVDDAQWLDKESLEVFAFVGRRLHADAVALLFGVRDPTDAPLPLGGLPELRLGGLGDDDARALLTASAVTEVDTAVARKVLAGTGGNPLAITELASALTPPELRGEMPLPDPLPVGEHLAGRFRNQIGALPSDTRTLLLLAAAEPSGDPAVLWRASVGLGLAPEAADPAVASGILEVGSQVRFRHPLIRSAAYAACSPTERARAHLVLAAAMPDELEADRRAAHLAAAASEPDEAVAHQLERSAERARGRGGYSAESDLLARAAELTPDRSAGAGRLLLAGQAAVSAGEAKRARRLIEQARLYLVGERAEAEAMVVDGRVCALLSQYSRAADFLLPAAVALQGLEPASARDAFLEAIEACLVTRHLAAGVTLSKVAATALARPRSSESPTITDLLLNGFSTLAVSGYADAAPILRLAVTALSVEVADEDVIRWCLLGTLAAQELLDEERREAWLDRVQAAARRHGALHALRAALMAFATSECHAGRLTEAEGHQAEAREITAAIGGVSWDLLRVELDAWRGRDEETRQGAADLIRGAVAFGLGAAVVMAERALVILALGQGRFEEALGVVGARNDWHLPGGGEWRSLPDAVEAGARAGRPDVAARALTELEGRATAAGTPLALGLLARARAVAASDHDTERFHQEAIGLLGRTRARTDLARAHLLYGEWLVGQARPADALAHLRVAHLMLADMGADAFANRAALAMTTVGARAGPRTAGAKADLTAQEARIAGLAASGATNPQIAGELFVSASTVDYHLRKVYKKLGVSSRRQLADRRFLEGA
jgi:DNA-binding CsgD family transcriptional regulator